MFKKKAETARLGIIHKNLTARQGIQRIKDFKIFQITISQIIRLLHCVRNHRHDKLSGFHRNKIPLLISFQFYLT